MEVMILPTRVIFVDDEGEKQLPTKEVTLAQWRLVKKAASKGEDKWTLRSFRLAVTILDEFEGHGFPDAFVPLKDLDEWVREDASR